jgi:hypothetical protein
MAYPCPEAAHQGKRHDLAFCQHGRVRTAWLCGQERGQLSQKLASGVGVPPAAATSTPASLPGSAAPAALHALEQLGLGIPARVDRYCLTYRRQHKRCCSASVIFAFVILAAGRRLCSSGIGHDSPRMPQCVTGFR